MNIAVCVKEVIDARLPLLVVRGRDKVTLPDGGGEPARVINPADRTALELALRLREALGGRVAAFSVCDEAHQDALYFARARGAERVERIGLPEGGRGPPVTALALASRLRAEPFDLVLCGDQTLDNSAAMVGPLLGELLGVPHVGGVCRLREPQGRELVVERRLERGHRQVVQAALPVVLSATADAVRPQYVTLRRLERAGAQAVPVWQAEPAGGAQHLPGWPAGEKMKQPTARVKNKAEPATGRGAADRLRMMMGEDSGAQQSASAAPERAILDGDVDELSEQLFRFLRHHEYI